ncbi:MULTISPECIES: NAD(P)/FAD-dependent oxidoreductase [Dictyoglomus]|uniref:NAD(P)/FAD-dependent oxidoreductase n=1 Tax=Dictyoglomus TaxID=13 RepID=UPI002354A24E|nr:FAD-dependent oxidoreductase [Dictyoglomus turgidum]
MRYVIIGNSIAAAGCIEGIRKIDDKNEIVVISNEPYHIYSRPLISYWLSKKISDEKIYYRPFDYYEKYKVKPILGRKVERVDFENRKLYLDNKEEIYYDKLLIATGGKPFIPNIPGLNKKNVFTFIKFDDVKAIDQMICPGKRTIVVGGGLSGLKAAEALTKRGCEVIVIELAERILGSILDEEGAKLVQEELENHGIKFILKNSLIEILGDEKVEKVKLQDQEILPADLVVFSIGVIPNVDIFKDTPLNINRGIIVNEKMETNIPDVYAAGDVVSAFDLILEQNRVIPILPNAYIQGEIAGQNMAGKEVKYEGGFPINSIGFFDIHIMTGGIVNSIDSCEILKRLERNRKVYRKVYLKDGRILGFMFINSFDRTGMIVDLMKNKVDVSEFKERLLWDNFGFLDFPKEMRREKIWRV